MLVRPLTNRDDRALATAVIEQGSERAFRELYRRHTPRLLGFVSRLLGRTTEDAEDAVQETWMRACKRLDHFRWNASLPTWLTSIGLNVVRDQLRRTDRPDTVVAFDDINLVAKPDHPGDRIDLERAVAMLPDSHRLVLVLHDVEGMKHREIADRLDVPVGTSKARLSRARQMMRDHLSRSGGTIHGRP